MDVKERWEKAAAVQYGQEELLLGGPTSYSLIHDPKHIGFVFARYKFVMKMIQGRKRVLELGSGDGIGLTMIAKEVEKLYSLDWEEAPLDGIRRRMAKHLTNVELFCADPATEPLGLKVDAVINIDFLEHIEPSKEAYLMNNVVNCLGPHGVMITGTPNITSDPYASECSRLQHVNLKSQETLKELMEKYFHNVFLFGMNDEVLHTGFAPMCHYIWTIAVGPKERS